MKDSLPPAGPGTTPVPEIHRVALVYNERIESTVLLARRLAQVAQRAGREVCLVSAWEEQLKDSISNVNLAVTLGGDGTILRTARAAAPMGLPILGVNLGRLGFLTELAPEEAEHRLPEYLEGRCWVEQRDMLAVSLDKMDDAAGLVAGGDVGPEYLALNDVLLGRAERARVVMLDIEVNGAHLASLRADGIVIASPTGSTAYSLAAGGPIVHPYVGALLITPILPHLSFLRSIVIPAGAQVLVRVHTDHSAMCSIDGQIDIRLNDGAEATVSTAPYPARFLRARSQDYFYDTLEERLRGC